MGEDIFEDESLEFNWANNLKYAAYETLMAYCTNVSHACISCKARNKCQVFWIHDAVCGKLGCHWMDLGDKTSEWTKLRKWANAYFHTNYDKIHQKF